MTWAIFDDKSPHHPKLIRVGAEAGFLWYSAICYSNAHALDGKIAKDIVAIVYPPLAARVHKVAAVLCRERLWHDNGDHYEIHDYSDHQERALKHEQDAAREYERNRKRRQREGARDAEGKRVSGTLSGTLSGTGSGTGSGTLSQDEQQQKNGTVLVGMGEVGLRSGSASEDRAPPLSQHVRLGYEKRLLKRTSSAPPGTKAVADAIAAFSAWADATADARGVNPWAFADSVLDAFFADPEQESRGFLAVTLAGNPKNWADKRPASNGSASPYREL